MSQKLDWKDLEISDHTRGVIKTTITFDRANAPATTLRRRLRTRLNRQPNTVGVLWTNANHATTAVTLSIEHINMKYCVGTYPLFFLFYIPISVFLYAYLKNDLNPLCTLLEPLALLFAKQ